MLLSKLYDNMLFSSSHFTSSENGDNMPLDARVCVVKVIAEVLYERHKS